MKAFDLSGKVAIVTGAGRGLGRSMSLALAEAGCDLVLLARREADLAAVANEIERLGRRALALPIDVAAADAAERAVNQAVGAFGSVDILVNNAGMSGSAPAVNLSLDDWEAVIRLNLTAPFLFSKAAGKRMIESGKGGKIINVASMYGLSGEPNLSAYCSSKGGLIQLTRTLAVEWARHGIQVNAMAPGYFDTDMAAPGIEDAALAERLLKRIPARRFGKPEELGPLTVFLASSASDYMTGEVVVMDGGQSAR